MVLIRPDLVKKLSLPVRTLKTPEIMDVAIRNGKEKKKLKLNEFVILSATSQDQVWSSKWVHEIITSNLCMPIIFGLPFLSHNHIVIDHLLCSCIDKKTGYDLIHPDVVLPLPKKLSPKKMRK